MKINVFKTVFGFNLEIVIDKSFSLNFEFREKDFEASSDLTSSDGWLICVITRNGTPILGKEYWE